MPKNEFLVGWKISLREICVLCALIIIATLISFPVARYYWIKGKENATVIRQWSKNTAQLHLN